MAHAPRALVSDARLTLHFLSCHAILGRSHQIHDKQPSFERRRGFVENRASGRVDVKAAVADIGATVNDGVKLILAPAFFARQAVRKPHLENVSEAGNLIGELNSEVHDGVFFDFHMHLFRSHVSNLAESNVLSRDNRQNIYCQKFDE